MTEHTPSCPVPANYDRPVKRGCPRCGSLEWLIYKGQKACGCCDYNYEEKE